jgi:hypothetical protein
VDLVHDVAARTGEDEADAAKLEVGQAIMPSWPLARTEAVYLAGRISTFC